MIHKLSHSLVIGLLLLLSSGTPAQQMLPDPRDGQQYPIVQLGDYWWYTEDARYISEFSYYATIKDQRRWSPGNFYPMAEADSACPPGWTIPTVRIWDATLPLLSASDTLNQFQEHHNFYTHDLDLWEEATPLNFNHMNWVQGDRIRKASGSYWFYDEETGDHRTHVHIGKNSAVRHAHDHHIADKPKKVRRFAVRCVAPDSLLYFPPMKSAGLRTLVYMVADLEAAKLWYTKAFGKKPYFDEPFYVGFDIGGYELGLSPIDTPSVGTNAIAYWDVEDVEKAVAALVALGATVFEAPQEVGEGLIVATVLDPWGNPVGLIRNPHFKLPK